MTPQKRAEKASAAMFEQDIASREMGMKITSIAPGAATMTMRVAQNMINGAGICHGGFIFSLADSAFAFACNSYNRLTVAQQNQITYISPGRVNELLTASAVETALSGRSGVYDVTVTGEDGRIVATMRGLSRTIKGHLFTETGEDQ